jgi:NCAIR mutase (PurE)-related protein
MSSFERPFDAIRRELQNTSGDDQGGDIRLDFGRERRTGIPEIVLGGRKPALLIVEALVRLANANGRALATRLTPDQTAEIVGLLPANLTFVEHPVANALVVAQKDAGPPCRGGKIGVITAGSSDAVVAAEAALIAREMGCRVMEAYDVGVAGLHRLLGRLDALGGADAIVVVAGMEGALPSVVGGLVDCPVIAVPTSIGYGASFGGLAALLGMLNSCASNVVAVNIDAGFNGGHVAGLIARRAGLARRGEVASEAVGPVRG